MNGFVVMLLSVTIMLTGGMPTVSDQNPSGAHESAAYQLVSPPYPQEVEEAWQAVRTEGGYRLVTAGQTHYIVISAGQRPTGGYSLYVDRVEEKDGKTIVYVGEQKPSPSAMTTQAITYPSIVVALPDNGKAIDVVFTSSE